METYTLGYKFRIYPNRTQENLINRTLGCAFRIQPLPRGASRRMEGANHNSLTYVKTSKLLTDLKKRARKLRGCPKRTAWHCRNPCGILTARFRTSLQSGQDTALQESKHSQPVLSDAQSNKRYPYHRQENQAPEIGLVRIKQSRDFDGRILSATVSRTASGKYYVSLCVEAEKESLLCPNNGKRIGIDVGLKVFYSDSNGDTVENPHPLKKLQRKLRREQRWLSRKMPKSVNRKRARVRVARVHERIANIRRDFLHKISTRLARENQTVAVEHLNIKGMLRNHKLAKSISDVSWSEFFRQLSYKTERHGGELLKVDTFYPSSQTCSVCGYQNPLTEDLSVREWDCPACGTHHDRDVNAAKNILRKALEDKSKAA